MHDSDDAQYPYPQIDNVTHLHSDDTSVNGSAAAHNSDDYAISDSEDTDMQPQNHLSTPSDAHSSASPIPAFVHLTQVCPTPTEEISNYKGKTNLMGEFGPVTQVCTSLPSDLGISRKNRNNRQFPIPMPHIATDLHSKVCVMPKLLTQPSGTSFRRAQAVQVQAHIGSPQSTLESVVIDSGSNITLISKACWNSLSSPPQLETSHRLSLIQLTGSANVSGYVCVNLYFATPGGLIQLAVDAYVVDGMSTPFVLGNDFQDQYMLSILREEGNTEVVFGNSGIRVRIENSTSSSGIDDGNHVSAILQSPKLKASESERLMKSWNQAASIQATEPFIISHFIREKRYRQLKFHTPLAQNLTAEKIAENIAERLTIPGEQSKNTTLKNIGQHVRLVLIPIPIPIPNRSVQSTFRISFQDVQTTIPSATRLTSTRLLCQTFMLDSVLHLPNGIFTQSHTLQPGSFLFDTFNSDCVVFAAEDMLLFCRSDDRQGGRCYGYFMYLEYATPR